MKKNRPNRYLSAAVAGLLAGSALLAGTLSAQEKNGETPKSPAAGKSADKNSCKGPGGCGSKSTDVSSAKPEKDMHVCKGKNACKGKGACKAGDNGCAGKNSCKGKGGCATAAAKHECKGHNACKGMGGCAAGDNGCAGKNSCKGKGGCAVPVQEKKAK